ncbi:hypothetical protein M9Y10_010848 [Tritrichomonas musculus]|uniref:Uncharacterized protein n=1 Tax=Tritrichomonas musculus TaxID=1915356 RepID=A0ABR2IM03_9EUKA
MEQNAGENLQIKNIINLLQSSNCIEHFQKAETQDAESMFYVGRNLIEGTNEFPQSIDIGLKYIIRASELHNYAAMEYYASLLFKGDILPQDKTKSTNLLTEVISKTNSITAKLLYAQIEYSKRVAGANGFDDSEVNYVLAKEYSKEAAKSTPKNTEAMILYAKISQKEKTNKFGSIERDFNESFKYFKEAANLGNGDGMAYLGNFYSKGYGVTKIDKNLSLHYYRQSSKSGNLTGSAFYGGLLIDNENRANEQEGLRLIKYACDRGNPQGMVAFGYSLFWGDGDLTVDKEKASKYFKMAADLGHDMGMNNYACDLRDGIGVPRNIDESVRYFKLAIEEGNILSARNYGNMLCKGFHDDCENVLVQADRALGKKYLKYAADHDDVIAIEEYASQLLNDEGNIDVAELRTYLERGVQAKSTLCMKLYGAILLDGVPFEKDLMRGASYFKMAVDLNDENAMNVYGELLESGIGVDKDVEMARRYFQQAADLGDESGIENYARFLEEGIGGEKCIEEGKKYRDLLLKS